VEYKLKAFEADAKVEQFKRKVFHQAEELQYLAAAKSQGEQILQERIRKLEKQLKRKRKENADLNQKVTYLESLQDHRMADLMSKNPEAMKRKFHNMQRRIRPKKFRPEMDVLDQEIPTFGMQSAPEPVQRHSRIPSAAFGFHIPQQPSYGALQPNPMSFGHHIPTQGVYMPYEHYRTNPEPYFEPDFGDI